MSFAEVLADDLNISLDSAYRRIRSDTSLTFEEIQILCNKYKISLDAFFSGSDDCVLFNYRAINHKEFTFEKYFQSLIFNLETIRQYEASELIYTAKDIPLFHIFNSSSLTAFKVFFWNYKYFGGNDQIAKAFSLNNTHENLIALAKQAYTCYQKIPSIEIWSQETVNNTLKQIEHAYQIKILPSKKIVRKLCSDLKEIIENVRFQAELGMKKARYSSMPSDKPSEFVFFHNNLVITDNTVYYRMGDIQMVHMGHNVINILTTTDTAFCNHTYQILRNIINNSTLLKTDAGHENDDFFGVIQKRIDELIAKIA